MRELDGVMGFGSEPTLGECDCDALDQARIDIAELQVIQRRLLTSITNIRKRLAELEAAE